MLFSQPATKEEAIYAEQNAVRHRGSVPREAIIIRNLRGSMQVFEKKFNTTATSWEDIEKTGLDVDSFERDMGINFSENLQFLKAGNMVDNKEPVLVNAMPIDPLNRGKTERYVIWRDKTGAYSFSSIPENEIAAILRSYGVTLTKLEDNQAEDFSNETKGSMRIASTAIDESLTHGFKVKKTAEVASVEMPKESTNWLLWLIGALVVLGGLTVVVRRNN